MDMEEEAGVHPPDMIEVDLVVDDLLTLMTSATSVGREDIMPTIVEMEVAAWEEGSAC